MSFLSPLLSLPKQEPSTALLASRGLRLQSILAHHHLRLSDKVRLCEQAVNYAREAKDVNTLITALIELAWAYKYAKQPEKCWTPLQEALDLESSSIPISTVLVPTQTIPSPLQRADVSAKPNSI